MSFYRFVSSKLFLKQLLIAGVVLVFIIIAALVWLKYSTNHQEYISVPNLAKLELDIAEKKLESMNLRYEIIDSTSFNPDFPRYSVTEQIPKAGSSVKENRKIYLSLNPSGYPKVEIPNNIIGKSMRQAKPSLLSVGLQVGEIKEVPNFADVVLFLIHEGDTLKPGQRIKKTTTIDLIVGDGKLKYGQEAPTIDTIQRTTSTSQNLNTNSVDDGQ